MKDLFGHTPRDPGIETAIPTWEQRGSAFADDAEIAAGVAYATKRGWTLYPIKLRLCFERTLAMWSHNGEELSHIAVRAVQRHISEHTDIMQNKLRGEKHQVNYPALRERYHDTVMWMLRQRSIRAAHKRVEPQVPRAAE